MYARVCHVTKVRQKPMAAQSKAAKNDRVGPVRVTSEHGRFVRAACEGLDMPFTELIRLKNLTEIIEIGRRVEQSPLAELLRQTA